MIEDGVEGLLVQPGDPERLAGSLGELAASPTRRAELGSAARERQARDFSLEAVVRQTGELYTESLGRPSLESVQPSIQVS
jgi:glycosyltransferase involved in cell wall biosynthesis